MSNHPQKSGSLCSGMSGSLCSGIGGSLYSGIGGSLCPGILNFLFLEFVTDIYSMIKCQQCLVFCSANDCCVISINRPFWRNEQEQGLILIGIFIELGVIEIEYELNKINIFNKIDEEPSLTGIFIKSQ
ncbi:MAG: hypothetical protein ACK48I_07400 [Bacteroidota bacterium]